jgi:DNA-binding PadR family transcriptional regulator
MPDLSPNAYAILGLLAARPWSAYELARHMKTSSNLRFVWPRAESKIYQAPKDLEAAGYAKSRKERSGARERTVYRITPAGRRALAHWLSVPAPPASFELEFALKIAYATASDIEQLRETLARGRQRRSEWLHQAVAGTEALLEDGFAVPERIHTAALVAELVARLATALGEWGEWAQAAVSDWETIELDDEKEAWARAVYEAIAKRARDALDDEESPSS